MTIIVLTSFMKPAPAAPSMVVGLDDAPAPMSALKDGLSTLRRGALFSIGRYKSVVRQRTRRQAWRLQALRSFTQMPFGPARTSLSHFTSTASAFICISSFGFLVRVSFGPIAFVLISSFFSMPTCRRALALNTSALRRRRLVHRCKSYLLPLDIVALGRTSIGVPLCCMLSSDD